MARYPAGLWHVLPGLLQSGWDYIACSELLAMSGSGEPTVYPGQVHDATAAASMTVAI